MLTVHHLGISQSERVLWLLEELGLDYNLVKHTRAPTLSPDSLKSVPGNATGKSPFLVDDDAGVTLSESGAIVEYIIEKHGHGRLALKPSHPDYADYLHWLHFANGTLQMMMVCSMFVDLAGTPADNHTKQHADTRLSSALQVMDDRLAENRWLAGEKFTAADIMNVYCLTTQRCFGPLISLAPYMNILRFLIMCGDRPAYRKAMEKGDPDMRLLLGPEPPSVDMGTAGGTKSDHWRKKEKK